MTDLSTEEKVAVLWALQEEMMKDIKEMRMNHLPHIERKIDSLIRWIMGAMFTALVALASQYI